MKTPPPNEHEGKVGSEQMADQSTVSAEGQDNPKHTERSNRTAPVFVYLIVLFVAAFAMLLLAYLIQMRNDAAAVCIPLRVILNSAVRSARPPDLLI